MVDFKGFSVQTRTLLIAGAAIAAVIILWPEDDRKSEAGDAKPTDRTESPARTGMPRFEERPEWRQPPLSQPAQPSYPGASPPYSVPPPAQPGQTYMQPPRAFEGYRFRSPDGSESMQPAKPPPFAGLPTNPQAGYGTTPRSPLPQFRPLERPREQTRRYSGGYPDNRYQEPSAAYPPTTEVPATPPPYYADPYGSPWEYPMYQDYGQPPVPPAPQGTYPGY